MSFYQCYVYERNVVVISKSKKHLIKYVIPSKYKSKYFYITSVSFPDIFYLLVNTAHESYQKLSLSLFTIILKKGYIFVRYSNQN